MRGRSETGVGVGHLILVGFHVGDEVFEGGRRKVLPGHQGHRAVGYQSDGLEIVKNIV